MYNAKQKESFIRDYTTKISVNEQAKRLFDLFEPYEEQWGADLCTRTTEEIQPVFDRIAGVRESSSHAPRTILRGYARWCMENGIPGATDAVMHLENAGADRLRDRMIRNPRHLQAVLDIICEPESEETADNYVRCYCWLAYAGLGAEDALTVRASEVDFTQMLIHHGSRDYPIYREALPAFRNCVRLTEFRYKHPNYPDRTVWKDRIPGDVLVRGIRSVPSMAVMQVELSRRLRRANEAGKTEMRLSYYRIWLSGVFYRMYEDELAGFPADFSAVVDEKLGDFQYKLPDKGNTQEYKRKKVAESYLSDYERWKQTLTV